MTKLDNYADFHMSTPGTPEDDVILSFTMARTEEEYIAEAMLLGLKYVSTHHVYVEAGEVMGLTLDPDTKQRLPYGSFTYQYRIKMVARMREDRQQENSSKNA